MLQKVTSLADSHGRKVRYLRLSVTDRCNLRCIYCVNSARQQYIPHNSVLRYEELLRIAKISSAHGIGKVRITGGEPLVRRDLLAFLTEFRKELPDLQLCITTNGVLIAPLLKDFVKLGLTSFNISLDSFHADTVANVVGQNVLPAILAGIEGLLAYGQTVKINAVAIRGITDVQMPDFIHALKHYPIDLRFIEFMPMGGNTVWSPDNFISARELLNIAKNHTNLIAAQGDDSGLAGPAKMFQLHNARGRMGFICAVSEHFCARCNRLRLTSSGGLRVCLFSDHEYNLARLLRHKAITDTHIARVIEQAMLRKPFGSELLAARAGMAVALDQMVGIGG